jgi:hypothetical protein
MQLRDNIYACSESVSHNANLFTNMHSKTFSFLNFIKLIPNQLVSFYLCMHVTTIQISIIMQIYN